MTDFYLHKYTTNESMYCGFVAPHKYRLQLIKTQNQQNTVLNAWKKDKQKILKSYIIELEKYYEKTEIFLLFVPPTNTNIFTNDIVEKIKLEYPNVIDLVGCFKKTSDVSFGDIKYNDFTTEQLLKYISVDKTILNKANNKITKAFIVDDVHSSGKSIKLTKHLIKTNISDEIEIKSGVILTTT
jgi:hypothetical protein